MHLNKQKKEPSQQFQTADELKRVNKWEIPPKPSNIMNTWNDDDDDEKQEYGIEEDGINEAEDLKDIVSDLEKLHANNPIENKLLKKGQSMARKVNIDIPSVGIPTYQNVTTKQESNNSLFVPVVVEGRSIFIGKKTAVWLLNDGERVSSDRMFRVRSQQPNESNQTIKLSTIMSDPVENKPLVSNHVVIGDFCVDIKSRQCHITTENMYIPIDYYKFTLTMEFHRKSSSR